MHIHNSPPPYGAVFLFINRPADAVLSVYLFANTVMLIRIFTFVFSCLFVLEPAVFAQKKAAKKVAQELQADVAYLASDELEGRRTGTEGERKAADYI